MNSKILVYSLFFSKLIIVVISMFVLVQIVTTVHWHFSPEHYQKVELTNAFKAYYGVGNFKLHESSPKQRGGKVFLDELTHATVYWLLMRGMFFAVVTGFIVRNFMQIIQSISNYKTFYAGNIQSMRRIGQLALAGAIMSAINFGNGGDGWMLHFAIPWVPIFTSCIAFILAEVFSEGAALQEDKNMIV